MSKKVKYEQPEDFYLATLAAAGMTVAEDGLIQIPAQDDGHAPLVIGEKTFYLPTKALRAKNKWDAVQPFHPLCEDVLSGQSLVFKTMLRLLPAYLSTKMIETINTLVKVGCDANLQKENNNPNADIILTECAVGIKPSLAKRFDALKNKLCSQRLVNIYISRDAEDSEGVKYSRLGTITYPLLDMCNSKDTKIADVDMTSKANKQSMEKIFRYIIQDIPTEVGSSDIVPYYHCYLKVLRAFTKRLNEINEPFLKVSKWEMLDEAWFDQVDDLSPLVGRIPKLPGNAGELPKAPAKRGHANVASSQFNNVKLPEYIEVDEEDVEQSTVTVSRERPVEKHREPERRKGSSILDYVDDYEDDYRRRPRFDERDRGSRRDDRYDDYNRNRYDDYDRHRRSNRRPMDDLNYSRRNDRRPVRREVRTDDYYDNRPRRPESRGRSRNSVLDY